MKAGSLSLAVAAAVFGASSLYLWWQLDLARSRAAQVEETTRQLNARVAELESLRNQLAERRAANAGGVVSGSFGDAGSVAPAVSPVPPQALPDAAPVWTAKRVKPSAALEKMMKSQMRAGNQRLYADLGRTLGLDTATAGKLIDLLTEQQLSGFGEVQQEQPLSAAELMRISADVRQRNEQEIADLIGADKLPALREYQASMPARAEFDMVAQLLEGNDAPLSGDQAARLLEIYVTERRRMPMPEYIEGMDHVAHMRAVNHWQSEHEERVAAGASQILDAGQLAIYNDVLQWNRDMREQFNAQPQAVPGTAGIAGNAVMFRNAAPAVAVGGAVTVIAPPPQGSAEDPSTRP